MSRPLVGPRLRRVLAYVPWIADHPGASLDEIAARFDVLPADLERDLELLPFVGLPPYTPDRLIEVTIVDECVWVRFADAFAAPMRFTADEGVALLAAGQALLDIPGSDPAGSLATALGKLAATLNAPAAIHIDVAAPDALAMLQDAVRDRHAVRIEYYSYHRNTTTTRVIEPWSVASLLGHWYVRAYCRNADAERLFRIDRVQAIASLPETFVPPDDAGVPDAVYVAHADDPLVTLLLEPNAAWVLDTYPVTSVADLGEGRCEVTLPVSSPAFLERLLLRLRGDARVLAPPTALDTAAHAAARIVQRYIDAAPKAPTSLSE